MVYSRKYLVLLCSNIIKILIYGFIYLYMVSLKDIEIGETYRFIIDQNGSEYEAVIEMDTMMSTMTETAVGMVRESDYPTSSGWGMNSSVFT